jgi:hypothetical protein
MVLSLHDHAALGDMNILPMFAPCGGKADSTKAAALHHLVTRRSDARMAR